MSPLAASCARCGGTGWLAVEGSGSLRARRCDCFRAGEASRRLEQAGIPAAFRQATLEEFHHLNDPRLKLAAAVAREFIDSWPLNGPTGILFHGPAGAGKTHLAVAIVIELVSRKAVGAVFVDFRDLLKTIQESWNPVSETSEKEVLRRVIEADLLALDDLGAEKPSPWVRETVAYVINARYVRGAPVLITTNLRYGPVPDGARASAALVAPGRGTPRFEEYLEERVGVPTLSRLAEMCKVVDLTGVGDYRRTAKIHGTERGFGRG